VGLRVRLNLSVHRRSGEYCLPSCQPGRTCHLCGTEASRPVFLWDAVADGKPGLSQRGARPSGRLHLSCEGRRRRRESSPSALRPTAMGLQAQPTLLQRRQQRQQQLQLHLQQQQQQQSQRPAQSGGPAGSDAGPSLRPTGERSSLGTDAFEGDSAASPTAAEQEGAHRGTTPRAGAPGAQGRKGSPRWRPRGSS